jgi:molybdate/tungstate transport system permease protein
LAAAVPVPTPKLSALKIVLVVAGLALVHLAVGLMPGSPLGVPSNVVLFAANLYVLACARTVLRTGSSWRVGLFATGYFVLFLLVLVLLERESLFILLVIAYASVFPVPYLLGYFLIFVLSFVVLQPYGFESFLPLCLCYALLWQAVRAGASRFLVGCLAAGLVALALVLLPLLHLGLQDSPRTLGFVLERPDVQRALWMSVLSSSLATVVVTLWGVPLAYAMARLPIRGGRLLEILVDLPILVPQSVVGVALLSLLGPGSPLGELLANRFGVQVAGQLAGVVLAQVFVSSPFLIKTAMTAFDGVPPHLESAARTLGASPARTFFRVALPLASRGVLTGMVLCWARAVSEFGAIILFAATPLTAPVLVHQEFARAGLSESRPIAVLLLLVCLWIFVLLQFGRGLLPLGAHRAAREERL